MDTLLLETTAYPDSDGAPMADNTKQFNWISLIKWELDALLPDAFVAGDLLWYPVQGQPTLRQAPDVLVALGRPKGDRGSYRQWEEDNIAPQVVFEILSPGNRLTEMLRKLEFYDYHGVDEYYVYDPDSFEFTALLRAEGNGLRTLEDPRHVVSPRLGIRFEAPGDRPLALFRPDGQPFRRPDETRQALERAEAETARLREKLRQLGIED